MPAVGIEGISATDIRGVVRMLGTIAGMTEPLADRRRFLITELAGLVRADIWIWVISRGLDAGTPVPLFIADGGYADDEECGRVWRANSDPKVAVLCIEAFKPDRFSTGLITHNSPNPAAAELNRIMSRPNGFDSGLVSYYPLGPGTVSSFGFHRRLGKSDFTAREQAIVHLIVGQLDWLHRAGTDMPANTSSLTELSPRLVETLLHVMSGDSRKKIARKMAISEHTVGDYLKALHKHFNVASRGELLAKFVGSTAS